MNIRKNGYQKLLKRVSHILEDNPQDIVDDDEGLIYTGGLWELVSPRQIDEEDEAITGSLKEEIIDNPRKIGSANLMYVQDLIEKYCDNNPAYVNKLPKNFECNKCRRMCQSFYYSYFRRINRGKDSKSNATY